MEQAGTGNAMLRRLKAEQPWCIYCGGSNAGTTVDHMPPISVFDLRRRPKGLEFLACQPCNSGARADEAVAALISRTYPDVGDDARKEELKRLMRGAERHNPGLLRSMRPSYRQSKIAREFGGARLDALNLRVPRVQQALFRFAAKLCFALHFHATRQIIPHAGGAAVYFFSNLSAARGRLPAELIELCGDPRTLAQGKQAVGQQFTYASTCDTEGTISAHFATFRLAFSLVLFAANNVEKLEITKSDKFFRPGFLRDAHSP